MPPNSDVMTKGERDDLARLVRQRERVAKTAATQRSAELLADFEQKLAAKYDPQDLAVAEIVNEAIASTEAINAQVDARCAELGIPQRFRPSINTYWSRRGENTLPQRRAELRKVAQTTIAAAEKRAKTEIEQRSLELQTRLVASGLRSYEARQFLASMPSIEELMPPLTVVAIEGVAFVGTAALPAGEQENQS